MKLKKSRLRGLLLLGGFLILAGLLVPAGRADDDDHEDGRKGRGRYRKYHEDDDSRERKRSRWGFSMEDAVEPVDNALYRKECGACHMAFQPGLLPGRSWARMLNNLEEHFGKDASLSPKVLQEVRVYLIQNAAETSRGETAYKILRSLDGSTPLRITEVSYIRRKHDEITPRTLRRKSIGTLANCAACHRTAEQGRYDDDDVVIPR